MFIGHCITIAKGWFYANGSIYVGSYDVHSIVLDRKLDVSALKCSNSLSLHPECGKYIEVRHRLWKSLRFSSVDQILS